uniref:Nucleocapsid protein n=1 Tax=Pakpunavirus sp. TaxID=2833053 RepID=A0AB39BYM8_9CAUD
MSKYDEIVKERNRLKAENQKLRLSNARMFGELYRIGHEFPQLEARCAAARAGEGSK